MKTDHASALRVVHALYTEHHDRWGAGLKRDGGGRAIGDWLAMMDLREMHDAVAFRARLEGQDAAQ